MTIIEALADRDDAGKAYAKAAAAYVAAWIDLHAHDLALADRTADHRGFGDQPIVLAHGAFLPDVAVLNRDPHGQSLQRLGHILAKLD